MVCLPLLNPQDRVLESRGEGKKPRRQFIPDISYFPAQTDSTWVWIASPTLYMACRYGRSPCCRTSEAFRPRHTHGKWDLGRPLKEIFPSPWETKDAQLKDTFGARACRRLQYYLGRDLPVLPIPCRMLPVPPKSKMQLGSLFQLQRVSPSRSFKGVLYRR